MSRSRRSVRLPHYDYAGPGLYFVTVCTHGRAPLFGAVPEDTVVLSGAGRIAAEEWARTAEVRPNVVLDAFAVMPDHVHLLFGITGDGRRGTPPVCPCPPAVPRPDEPGRRFGNAVPGSVATIMRQYKSIVTKRIRQADPSARVWQRGYHDRVVRTAREAEQVRRYIEQNPARWSLKAEERRDGHCTL